MKNLPEKSRAESAKKRCQAIGESIAAADSAIAEKRAIIAASNPDESRVKAAREAVEDALAIQATGGEAGDLDALRADLGAAEAAFSADSAACRNIVGDAETAIAGLSRRRAALKQEFDEAACPPVIIFPLSGGNPREPAARLRSPMENSRLSP